MRDDDFGSAGVGVDADVTPASAARLLVPAQKASGAAREVLRIRGKYIAEIVQYRVEVAKLMTLLVEQDHDAVYSSSYFSVRESLNQRLESKAAKLFPKAHLDRATGFSGWWSNM
jgi:hypothetical protein